MGLSYADAVRLVGGKDSRIVAALDRLTGGLLLAGSAVGGVFVLSLLGARGELARRATSWYVDWQSGCTDWAGSSAVSVLLLRTQCWR